MNPREYYADVRVKDVDDQDDGDMLLFQWGTYDWGSGRSFQYDLTRQVIHHEGGRRRRDLATARDLPLRANGGFSRFIDGSGASACARSHRSDRGEIGFELAT